MGGEAAEEPLLYGGGLHLPYSRPYRDGPRMLMSSVFYWPFSLKIYKNLAGTIRDSVLRQVDRLSKNSVNRLGRNDRLRRRWNARVQPEI